MANKKTAKKTNAASNKKSSSSVKTTSKTVKKTQATESTPKSKFVMVGVILMAILAVVICAVVCIISRNSLVAGPSKENIQAVCEEKGYTFKDFTDEYKKQANGTSAGEAVETYYSCEVSDEKHDAGEEFLLTDVALTSNFRDNSFGKYMLAMFEEGMEYSPSTSVVKVNNDDYTVVYSPNADPENGVSIYYIFYKNHFIVLSLNNDTEEEVAEIFKKINLPKVN